jgi:hypothetical protein
MKDVIESNKLIADFMNYRWNFGESFDELKYHSSWDWLMPVVEKIWVSVPIDVREINNEGLLIFEIGLFSDLRTVYEAVVQFIKMYNERNWNNDN